MSNNVNIPYVADVILFGFIRSSQKQLNTTSPLQHIPNEVSTLCMMYYYHIQDAFDSTLNILIDSSSSIKLDGNKYFFNFFLTFSKSTNENRHYMIDKKLISILGHLYLGPHESPYTADANWKYHAMESNINDAIIIETITTLFCACHTPQTKKIFKFFHMKKDQFNDDYTTTRWLRLPSTALSYNSNNNEYPKQLLHKLSENDSKLGHSRFFYDKMLKQSHCDRNILRSLNNLFTHWSFCDQTYSGEIVKFICGGMNRAYVEEMETYVTIMRTLILNICKDKYDFSQDFKNVMLNKLHTSEKGVLQLIKSHSNNELFAYEWIKGIILIMVENDEYAEYMISKRDEWLWWDIWLSKYCFVFYMDTYQPLLIKHRVNKICVD